MSVGQGEGMTAAPRGRIRDRGYQPYAGELTPDGARWRVIAARTLRSSARQAWVIGDAYLAGKLASTVALVGVTAIGPPLALALLRLALATDGAEALRLLPLPFAALGFGVLETLALAAPAVALSSLAGGRGAAQG